MDFTIVINEDIWRCYLVDDNDNVIAEEDASAETDPESKEIYFRRSSISEAIVRHEIWHVFYYYTFTQTASLSSKEVEEVSSELFAYRADRMLEVAKFIYEQLVSLRNLKDE